jgi:hypothetical protein
MKPQIARISLIIPPQIGEQALSLSKIDDASGLDVYPQMDAD